MRSKGIWGAFPPLGATPNLTGLKEQHIIPPQGPGCLVLFRGFSCSCSQRVWGWGHHGGSTLSRPAVGQGCFTMWLLGSQGEHPHKPG